MKKCKATILENWDVRDASESLFVVDTIYVVGSTIEVFQLLLVISNIKIEKKKLIERKLFISCENKKLQLIGF